MFSYNIITFIVGRKIILLPHPGYTGLTYIAFSFVFLAQEKT